MLFWYCRDGEAGGGALPVFEKNPWSCILIQTMNEMTSSLGVKG